MLMACNPKGSNTKKTKQNLEQLSLPLRADLRVFKIVSHSPFNILLYNLFSVNYSCLSNMKGCFSFPGLKGPVHIHLINELEYPPRIA